MSGDTIAMLARDPELRKRFREDPLGTLKVVVEMTGGSASRLSAADIDLIKSLSDEEFEMLYSVVDKMKGLKIPNFRL